jgi:metallophosphoesterase superfamily enzyme
MLTDSHFGYERKNGHKVALHDANALDIAYQFIEDFKPDQVILGGDILDCGVVSHHNHGKPGRTEGMRLISDAEQCRVQLIDPLKDIPNKTFITGNHEDWLTDLSDDLPALEGMLDISNLLGLEGWNVIPQGGAYNLGKLTFVHGDQIKGGEHVAKAAVTDYERSIRFGHFHTFQAYSKTAAVEAKVGKTGMAVPCLCTKNPRYNESKPNRWMQGINAGYVFADGTFSDQVYLITGNKMVAEGKVYRP